MAAPFNNAPQPHHQAMLGRTMDKNRLQFVSVLGIGAYGVVYLAKDVSASIQASTAHDPTSPYSGQGYYAVKCLNKHGLDDRQKAFQRREITLHTLSSSHPNVVSLHRVVETASTIYVILAFCPDGDLFSMITEKSRYLGDNELIRSVFLQIVDAVAFCHKLGIYHRDLKPENILCSADGTRVMLADFGLATTDRTSRDFGCGSTFYMSPECQSGLVNNQGCYSTLHNDVWSLGVILVNLTCGRNPWKQACPSDETFNAYLSNPDFLCSILPISGETNALLKRIFALDPERRISLAELRQAATQIQNWTLTEEQVAAAKEAEARRQQDAIYQQAVRSNAYWQSQSPQLPQQSYFSADSMDEVDCSGASYSDCSTSFSQHEPPVASTSGLKQEQRDSASATPRTRRSTLTRGDDMPESTFSSPSCSSASSCCSSEGWSMPSTPDTPYFNSGSASPSKFTNKLTSTEVTMADCHSNSASSDDDFEELPHYRYTSSWFNSKPAQSRPAQALKSSRPFSLAAPFSNQDAAQQQYQQQEQTQYDWSRVQDAPQRLPRRQPASYLPFSNFS